MGLRMKRLKSLADVQLWAEAEAERAQERLVRESLAREADPTSTLLNERVGRFDGYRLALSHLLDRLPKD
jgi:hypothetical protein